MDRKSDVLVVGGGLIGLSIAWRVAQRGRSVTLIERGLVGQEASGAAAGMLAPFAEAKSRGPFSDLGMASLSIYGDFVQELERESSLSIELVRTGLLRVACDEEEAELRETYGAMREMGSHPEWVDCAGLRKLEPALSPSVTAAIYSPTEWQLEPRRMVAALAVAAAKQGVCIVERATLTGFVTGGSLLKTVETTIGNFEADRVVIAGGSWNASIAGFLGCHIPVRPIRGQIVALGPIFPALLSYTIYSQHGYLVPKSDGRIFAGSTEDDAGFDTRPTAGGVAEILEKVLALAPSLATAPIDDVWSGLRPMATDRMPILGRLQHWDNAFVAAGHFRNGILLTPITAKLMSSLVIDGEAVIDPAFSASRFEP